MAPILASRGGASARAFGFGSLVAPLGDYQAIMTATVDSGGASSITFSSIPSTYKHLQIREISRNTRAAAASNNYITLNGDTGANYSWHLFQGDGGSASANGSGGASQMLGLSASNGLSANIFSASIYDILDYTDTNKYKTLKIASGYDANGSGYYCEFSGSWRSTAAVTSFSMYAQSGDYMPGSQFALYGLKG